MSDCYLLEERPSEECGCPEQEWVMWGVSVTIHEEEDGSGHIFMDFGDGGEHEIDLATGNLEIMREVAQDFISKLPFEQ